MPNIAPAPAMPEDVERSSIPVRQILRRFRIRVGIVQKDASLVGGLTMKIPLISMSARTNRCSGAANSTGAGRDVSKAAVPTCPDDAWYYAPRKDWYLAD